MMIMELPAEILDLGRRAKAAARELARLSSGRKNAGLLAMADALGSHRETILAANALDVAAARDAGISGAMIDRLRLYEKRLAGMADGVHGDAAPADPRDGAEQLGRQPRHQHDDLPAARRREQPRLVFDQGDAAERQGRGQALGPVLGLTNGEEETDEHRVGC